MVKFNYHYNDILKNLFSALVLYIEDHSDDKLSDYNEIVKGIQVRIDSLEKEEVSDG